MYFKFAQGKNFKDYIYICDLKTKDDFEVYQLVKGVITRSEYNPFVKNTFNKKITATYLMLDYVFPYQFWEDVKKVLTKFIGIYLTEETLVLRDDPYENHLYNYNSVKRDEFDEWVKTLNPPEDISLDKDEYKYQQDAVFDALNRKTCKIEIATSGGKTFITYMYARYLIEHTDKNINVLVIVPSQYLCKQLKKDFANYDVNNTTSKVVVESIYAGSKLVLDANVVCGTYQSLGNYDESYFDDFNVMVCDELHRAKAYTIRNNIYAKLRNCEYVLGMTGSFPKYNTLDYLHIVAMFGPSVIKVSVKKLIDTGVANKVIANIIKIKYDGYKSINDVLNKLTMVEGKYALEKDFFQNCEPRMHLLSRFINKFEDNTIIFTITVAYCERLAEYLKEQCPDRIIKVVHHEIKHRDDIIEEMKTTDKKFVMVATFATMSTGVSIKNLTNAYIVDSGKSSVQIKQSAGRLMRLLEGKNTSQIFDFRDELSYSIFAKHSREREAIYKEMGLEIKNYETTLKIE